MQGGFLNRNGGIEALPDGPLSGPKVCITNAATASTAINSLLLQAGQARASRRRPTGGGVRCVGGGFPLLDGGSLTVPHDVLFDAKGEWVIENPGESPDRSVVEMPEDNSLDHDRAFNDAVAFLNQTPRSKPAHHQFHSQLPAYPHFPTPDVLQP
jgi:tricorn protease